MSRRTPNDVDTARFRALCGLMALSNITPMEHSVFRSLLYAGKHSNVHNTVVRSLSYLAERAGRTSTKRPPSTLHPDKHRQVRAAFKSLREKGLVDATLQHCAKTGRSGRGHKFMSMLQGDFPAYREPQWRWAHVAANRMSVQVSPIGPSLEKSYFELLWALDSNGERTGTIAQWADWLRRSPNTALDHLQRLASAGIGLSLVALPKRGRSAREYRVMVKLPPKGEMPSGARRHAEMLRQEAKMLAEASRPVATPSPDEGHRSVVYVDVDGRLEPYELDHDDDDDSPPWDLLDGAGCGKPDEPQREGDGDVASEVAEPRPAKASAPAPPPRGPAATRGGNHDAEPVAFQPPLFGDGGRELTRSQRGELVWRAREPAFENEQPSNAELLFQLFGIEPEDECAAATCAPPRTAGAAMPS